MNLSNNFENLIFLYSCKKKLLPEVNPEWFATKHMKLLIKLCNLFYKKFSEFPFDINSSEPSLNQIEELVKRNPSQFVIDPNYTEAQNIESFLLNVKLILETNYNSYSISFIEESCTAWLNWQEFQNKFEDAIELQKTTTITPENVQEIIKKSKSIILKNKTFGENEEDLADFYEPSNHVQPLLENLKNSGFPTMNKWVSGDPNGGFEEGTVSLFVGESNIGKCVHKDTKITIRNKNTGLVEEITYLEFWNRVNQ